MIETREGEEWVRFGSYLYRPLGTIKALNTGGDTIEIGSDGFAECRSVTINTEKTVSVATSGPWRLYDSSLTRTGFAEGTKAVTLSAGTYYMVFHFNAAITTFPVSDLQVMRDSSVSDSGLPGAVPAVVNFCLQS